MKSVARLPKLDGQGACKSIAFSRGQFKAMPCACRSFPRLSTLSPACECTTFIASCRLFLMSYAAHALGIDRMHVSSFLELNEGRILSKAEFKLEQCIARPRAGRSQM